MARNGVQEGCVLSWTNGTAAAVVSGQPVAFGMLGMGIATVDIAVDASGSVAMEGVWTLAKSTGAVSQGDKMWWNDTAQTAINSPSLNAYFIGYATEAAGSSDTTVNIALEEFDSEGIRVLTLAATGNQALKIADFLSTNLLLIVPNTAAKTITLPAVATIPKGATFYAKKTDATAAAITFDPAGSETIDGGSTYASMDANGDHAQFANNGTSWTLLNSVIA